jgi:hypothetical protein
MSYFVVDVESDGDYPPDYSMVCFGAVRVDDKLETTFYGLTKPISTQYKLDALAISGFNRLAHETFDSPVEVMQDFRRWLQESSDGKPTFISDNVAYDWQWINYYMHKYTGSNPFGFSGRRIGDLYCGLMKDAGVNADWKRKYRQTRHTHNPVDDAKGNAEALLAFRDKLGLKIRF